MFTTDFNIFSPLTPEQRNIEDAIVAFEVKDKDFLRTRFMAEAFLPFSEIPDTEPESGFETLEQVHLKLSRPTKKSMYIITTKINVSLHLQLNAQLHFESSGLVISLL